MNRADRVNKAMAREWSDIRDAAADSPYLTLLLQAYERAFNVGLPETDRLPDIIRAEYRRLQRVPALHETVSAMSDESTRSDEDEAAEAAASPHCSCGAIHDGLEEFQRCKACGKII